MRFYLSSFHIGNRSADLRRLGAGRRIGLIPNALDHAEPAAARLSHERALDEVRAEGLEIETLDLKDHFGRDDISDVLAEFGGVWVRGGNTFVLRQAMRLSRCDHALRKLRNSDFFYGGYSAGVCVLAPTLHGLQQVDDPTIRPYPDSEVIWEGLGFLEYLVLPHYKSDHPESAAIDQEVEYCQRNGIAFRTLRDGEVIVIEEESAESAAGQGASA